MGLSMQIAKSPNATSAYFSATMAEKWQNKEKQQKCLAETKQGTVHNLNNVDEIIEIALGEDVDMDPAGIMLRDTFFNYHDKKRELLD
jgi:hypothetical protein